jgi:hypothetical protein
MDTTLILIFVIVLFVFIHYTMRRQSGGQNQRKIVREYLLTNYLNQYIEPVSVNDVLEFYLLGPFQQQQPPGDLLKLSFQIFEQICLLLVLDFTTNKISFNSATPDWGTPTVVDLTRTPLSAGQNTFQLILKQNSIDFLINNQLMKSLSKKCFKSFNNVVYVGGNDKFLLVHRPYNG